MDMTQEQIEKEFRRQVKLCQGIGEDCQYGIMASHWGTAWPTPLVTYKTKLMMLVEKQVEELPRINDDPHWLKRALIELYEAINPDYDRCEDET